MAVTPSSFTTASPAASSFQVASPQQTRLPSEKLYDYGGYDIGGYDPGEESPADGTIGAAGALAATSDIPSV